MVVLESLAISAIFRAIAPKAIDAIAKKAKSTNDYIISKLESTFREHIINTLSKCAQTNTIFSGDDSVPLKSIYTNLYLKRNKVIIRDEDLVTNSEILGNVIIHGTGGAGKTMMMKYLALQFVEAPKGKIPLFIELRNLPTHDSKKFYQTIFEYCTPEDSHDDFNIFREGLRNGIFIIFFDGLDEVSNEFKEALYNSIRRISTDYPKTRIIASTRPEIDTRNWGELKSYKVQGLSLDQARLLIKKIEFTSTLKEDFLELLDKKFFSKHESFLSVPLLCSLMLFTFSEFREVPTRLTVFYEQAFEFLFRKHDKMKPGYFTREFCSKLSADRFRTVFSAFCYRTLALNQLSFKDEEFHYQIRRSAEICEVEVSADDYGKDLVSAICVVMRDGLKLHFIHRSFQEYFAALFILRYRAGNDTFTMCNRIFEGPISSDVARMAFDMDQQAFERIWAYPAIEKVWAVVSRAKPENRPFQILRKSVHNVRIEGDPPKNVSAWAWSPSQNEFRGYLDTFGKVYSDFILMRPFLWIGRAKGASDFKELSKKGVKLPKELEEVCETGNYKGETNDRDHLLITIGKSDWGWLLHTTLTSNLETCLRYIENLRDNITSRVQEREELDILS